MNKTGRFVATGCLGLIALFGSVRAKPAGDTLVLSLAECIRLGQQQGPLSDIARASFQNKQHHYKSFSAAFYPQIALSADIPQFIRSINSITQPDGSSIFQLQRQATSSLSLGLQQRIPFTGTEVSLFSDLNRLDNLEANSSYYRATPLSLSFRQSIFSINTMAWNEEAEDLSYQAAQRGYIEGMEDAAADVVNKFFGYYTGLMNVANAKLNVATNDTLYEVSKGRFNVGKIAENDLLQSELALLNARTQLENALIEVDRALQALKYAMRIPAETEIAILPGNKVQDVTVDLNRAVGYARANRSDELNIQAQELAASRGVRQAQSDNSLAMSINANIGLNQKANDFDAVYRGLLDQQQFSVRVQVPLIGWGAGSHAVEAAEAERSRVQTSAQSQRFSMEQEVRYQVLRFRQLQLQVSVAAKADTIAQRRFDVARERYVIGKIDVPNLFLAQSEKDNAYRARIQALWDYWTTYYRLRRLTLYDFAGDRPLTQAQ